MAKDEVQLRVGDRIVTVRVREPEAYSTNPTNGNAGRERGVAAIESSIQDSGFHRGIVTANNDTVVNGNHAYQATSEKQVVVGWVEVLSDGTIGVATKRTDWETERDPRAIKAAIEDNRTNQLNFELLPEQFREDLETLAIAGLELPKVLFTESEIQEIAFPDFEPGEESDRPPGAPQEIECTCPNCGHRFVKQG